MADFFDELGKTIFQQSDIPDIQTFTPQEQLTATAGLIPQINQINESYAKGQVPLVDIENQIREKRFGPGISDLQKETVGSILGNLRMGSALPDELRRDVIRSALQGNVASGFNLTPGGRALVARDIGTTGEALGRSRRAEAMGALQAFPGEKIGQALTPLTALELERGRIQEENSKRAYEAEARAANRRAVISSISQYAELGGSVIGSAAGSAFGTKGWGSALGGIMGGGGGNMAPAASYSGQPASVRAMAV